MFAVLLFGLASGGAQLADALIYHNHPAPHAADPRVNAGDHCHSERCDLGAPITTASPPSALPHAAHLAVASRTRAVAAPVDVPRTLRVSGSLGSRAPPVRS